MALCRALHVLLCLLCVRLAHAGCQHWPCTAPCPANHKLLQDCLDRSKNTGECYFYGAAWCQWCDWGFHSAAENNKATCEQCPANTIVMQGRYSQRYNENVGEWCEEDCGVAFRNLILYPTDGYHFKNELFDPFGNIPCKQYNGEFSDCTQNDFALADSMIVQVLDDTMGAVYVERYMGWEYAMQSLVGTKVDSNGRKRITCQICPAGHFITKDPSRPKFQRITCQRCPTGLVSTTFDANPATFLPQDVKDMTKQLFGDIQFPAADFNTFACRACSLSEGVPNSAQGACEPCAAKRYQVAKEIQVLGVRVVVATECKACPEGYEYYNQQKKSATAPCRSIDGVRDCCKLCIPNYYSGGEGSSCAKVDENKGTLRPYGASGFKECGVGEELVYCSTAGVCESGRKLGSSRKIGWRTCRKCSESNIQRSGSAGVCVACKEDELAETTDKCVACSNCHELSSETKTQEVYVIHQDLQDQVLLLNPTVAESDFKYTQDVVQARCLPLPRRSVQAHSLLDADYYRERGQQKQLVPDFHTIIRSHTNCTRLHCADVCRNYFQYSPACGQQEKNVQSMWVVFENQVVLYKTLTPQQQTAQLYVHHGPCQPCKACTKGAYNGLCNVHVSGNDPAGSCKACITQCADGFFMHHQEQEAGCHAPPRHSARPTTYGRSATTTSAGRARRGCGRTTASASSVRAGCASCTLRGCGTRTRAWLRSSSPSASATGRETWSCSEASTATSAASCAISGRTVPPATFTTSRWRDVTCYSKSPKATACLAPSRAPSPWATMRTTRAAVAHALRAPTSRRRTRATGRRAAETASKTHRTRASTDAAPCTGKTKQRESAAGAPRAPPASCEALPDTHAVLRCCRSYCFQRSSANLSCSKTVVCAVQEW